MKKSKWLWYLLTFLPLLLIVLGYLYPASFFNSQENLREYISSFRFFAPIVFVLIQVLQVVITPINHYAVGILGGFLFGTVNGFLYNYIGRVVGSLIAFYLGRKFGRKILNHVVKEETLGKYDKLFEKGKMLLFLMYFLPFFPDDELSYLAGFSKLKTKEYILIMMLGHITGSLSLAYVGAGVSTKDPLFIVLSGISLIGGILIVLLYKRLV